MFHYMGGIVETNNASMTVLKVGKSKNFYRG
jgi:hypothetical protein